MATSKIKTLIVDDDPFILEMLATILEGEGYTVDVADNGAEAFKKVCTNTGIGLVISDMNMPGMSGLALIQKIRERGNDVPAIILSGDTEISRSVGALACELLVKDEGMQENIASFVAGTLKRYQQEKLLHAGLKAG